jgi:RNA polymerase sigma-70 factor, ECF subfamily
MDQQTDLALHLRLIAGDPVATLDAVERWLPELVRGLAAKYSTIASRDEHLIRSAAIETLFDYTTRPQKYNPEGSSLRSYLFMSAERDLQNALARDATQGRRAGRIDDVELEISARNSNFEERVIARVDAQTAWGVVLAEIEDPQDRRLLALLVKGENSTEAWAHELGIQDLSAAEQRKVVKRHKDRINKRLERLGASLNG